MGQVMFHLIPDIEITDDEKEICICFGKRIAMLTKKLSQ